MGTAAGDLGPVGQFVLGVVERLDLGPFEISESEEGRFSVYQLAGVAAEELTAAEGRATEAIQLLANQAAGRLSDDPKRVVVDAEGDRERREEFLGRMGERAARRARDTGRSVALDPMNARDRRGIHMALREMEGIATMSVGEGRYRQVVVVPEGAEEYEEALDSCARNPHESAGGRVGAMFHVEGRASTSCPALRGASCLSPAGATARQTRSRGAGSREAAGSKQLRAPWVGWRSSWLPGRREMNLTGHGDARRWYGG